MIRCAGIDMVPQLILDLEIEGQQRGEKKEMQRPKWLHLVHILREKGKSLARCGS